MANAKVLTPEQVEIIKLTLPLTPWSHSNRVTLYQLCATLEALRAQAERDAQRLADAQADVRALATAINVQGCNCGARAESPNTHPHVSGCPTGKALARPGVVQVLAKPENR